MNAGKKMTPEEIIQFLYSKENIENCEPCPHNDGFAGRYPCGQQNCWVAMHCKNEECIMIYTADRETGTFIDEFETVGDALAAIRQYEEEDKADETYEPEFYDVVNENHDSYIY